MNSEHPRIYRTQAGDRYPAGATPSDRGVNFSVYSRHATHVELLLFVNADDPAPFQVIPLEARSHRTFFFWHVFVIDLPVGTHYAWRIDGPDNLHDAGFRFDREKVLLDPWARGVTDTLWERSLACLPGSNETTSMRAVVESLDDVTVEGGRARAADAVDPFADHPLAAEIHSLIFRQADLLGTNMSRRLEEQGKRGVGHNMIFDSYWPGGTRNTAWWKNVTGLLTEVASVRIAKNVEAADITVSAAEAQEG